jgi:hypothetical protein
MAHATHATAPGMAAFPGFRPPFYTMVPNELFDELLPEVSGAELKVLMYVCRRTFGFGKLEDGIGLTQMLDGLVAKDGRRLDHGCGIKSKTTLLSTIRELVERRLLVAERRFNAVHGGSETTVYRLNVVAPGSGEGGGPKIVPPPGPKIVPPGGPEIGPPGGTKIAPTKEREKKSIDKKHHHPLQPVSKDGGSPDGDDDAFAHGALTPEPEVDTQVEPVVVTLEPARSAEVSILDGVVSRMLALGLSPRLAAQKAAEYPTERLVEVLDRLPHRKAKNPVGYFLAELSAGDFAAPAAVVRRERQETQARPLQRQFTAEAAAETALGDRIRSAAGTLSDSVRQALLAEARGLVARRTGRTLERVDPDSPLVTGMFDCLVEARYCRSGGQ